MLRAASFIRAAAILGDPNRPLPFELAVLTSEQRHLRRKAIELVHGGRVLVDLPEAAVLDHQDVLVIDDGRHVEIIAAEEELYDIRAAGPVQLAELAWHIGNRHLAAQIEERRILILPDPVIRTMLEGLGATVADAVEIFSPVRGAYSGGSHGHGHHHDHSHDHGHADPASDHHAHAHPHD
jgi:urease accessory protein